ncbi:uncharacterized protein LOC141643602 [Silene latifolia]|uniref:uncharacterized protein LOC141643602 n=1 Tax=Silene latifolia TaxID=37657 RepID=UPI003D76EAAC
MVSTRGSRRKANEEVVHVKQSKLSASSPKSSRRKPNAPRKFQSDDTKGRLTGMTEASFAEKLGICKLEQQTDEATLAAKYSGANVRAEHQLEDDQLSGSLAQATIRTSRIQDLIMPLYTTQETQKDASQEVNTMSNITAPEGAARGLNGLGAIRLSEKLNHFPNNTTTGSISLNMTEFADQNATNEFSDIDSVVGESSLMTVRRYQVKPEYVAPLTSILSMHGDIGAKCSLSSVIVSSLYMERLCDILQKLRCTSIGAITPHALQDMRASVTDIGNVNIEIGWLKNRLDEIFEAKKAIGQLQSTSKLKMLHTQRKKTLAEKKVQLEEHKRHYANIEAQSRDIRNLISAAQSDISTIENQVLETAEAISESRAKLKKVFDLKTLVDGLI